METHSRRYALIGFVVLAVFVGVACGFLAANRASAPDDEPTASFKPAPSQTTALGASDGGATDGQSTGDQLTPIQQRAQDFLTAYTGEADDAAWLDAMAPMVTAEMRASLATTNRDAARALAGTQIGDAQDGAVPVLNGGDTIATIRLAQVADNEDGTLTDATPWVVTGIDYTEPPQGVALPLSSTSAYEISVAIQPTLAAVIAQPGGLTDEARAAQITEAFTEPNEALQIPRTAGPETRINMGAVHDLQLSADANGNLIATVVIPWQVDGDPVAQWTTLTVRLTRTQDGAWAAADATNL